MANQYTLKNGGYEPFIGNFGLVPQPPIPEPDAEDNGKVLGVSDGSYALVNGGGGGMTVVQCVRDYETDKITLQKTAKEVFDSFESGVGVLVCEDYGDSGATYMQMVAADYFQQDGYTFRVEALTESLSFLAEGDGDYPATAGR